MYGTVHENDFKSYIHNLTLGLLWVIKKITKKITFKGGGFHPTPTPALHVILKRQPL